MQLIYVVAAAVQIKKNIKLVLCAWVYKE